MAVGYQIVSWISRFNKQRHQVYCITLVGLWCICAYGFAQYNILYAPHRKHNAFFTKKLVKPTQSALSQQLSKDIQIHYQLLRNLGSRHTSMITIKNTGRTSISLQNQTLYFCIMRTLVTTSNEYVKLSHVNGCLHKIVPVSNTTRIPPGQSINVEHTGEYFIGCRTHVMPNWYFIGPRDEVSIIANTMGEQLSFVGDFKTEEQCKREPGDKYHPYSPQDRYDVIGFDPPRGEGTVVVIPQPMYIANLDKAKTIKIDQSWGVGRDKGLETEAKILKAYFQFQEESLAMDKQPKRIILKIGDPEVKVQGSSSTSREAYRLIVNTADQYVEIIGKSAAGVFYGVRTLIALDRGKGMVAMVTIKDAPRFEYRGMHVDVSRNFQPKSAIFRLLEAMSMYKMNKFHFHLSDDEAWRLEIPGIPELTTVGSKRCHDPTGLKCIQPELGADPRGPTSPTYYTVQDYQDILKFASDRHIQVFPEIDTPGHCHAAIKAMETRYRNSMKKGNSTAAEEYLLTEFSDPTRYLSTQSFRDNTINPCLESTYRFISHVIKALVHMHKGVQPLTMYHFGGDEVPKNVWKDSPACERLTQVTDYGEKRSKIKEHFVRRVANIAHSFGLDIGGWDDFFSAEKTSFLNKKVIAFSWNDLPNLGGGEKAYLLAGAGYKVVLAHASHLYFDHPYEPDPEERGNHWATRFTDTRKVFEYSPNFCKTAGHCENTNRKDNIFGITGCLWTETVRTADQLEFMIFPRMLALAERAWHKAPWEDIENNENSKQRMTEEWINFSTHIVNYELRRLDRLGIKYRLPLPGARFDGKQINVRTALPGLPVQLSKDGGKTWYDVTNDTQIDSKVTMVTRSMDGLRMSRPIEIQPQ